MLRVWDAGNGSSFQCDSQYTPAAGTWSHYVVTIDASGSVSLYANGVAALQCDVGAGVPRSVLRTHLYLGASWWPVPVTDNKVFLNGALADFQFALGTAFTAVDAANLYSGVGCPPAAPTPPSLPVLGGTATVLAPTNSVPWPQLSLAGQADSFVSLGPLPFTANNAATNLWVEAWIYMRAYPAAGTDSFILQRGGAVAALYGFEDWGLRILSTGTLQFYSYGVSSTGRTPIGSATTATSAAAVTLDAWTHVAAALTPTNSIYTFINGALAGSAAGTWVPQTTPAYGVYIGSPVVVRDWAPLDAAIADLRIV